MFALDCPVTDNGGRENFEGNWIFRNDSLLSTIAAGLLIYVPNFLLSAQFRTKSRSKRQLYTHYGGQFTFST